jgi:hypothetical protein
MKNLMVAATFAAFAFFPASAKTVACSGENFAATMNQMATMPYGHKRMGMMREMTALNTDLSNGDLRGACKHYVIAQRIQNNEPDPFAGLLLD